MAPAPTTNANNDDASSNIKLTTANSSDADSEPSRPDCDRTFTSHIDLVGHFRTHRTQTGEPVPETPTYTRRIRLHCPHCARTSTPRMGLIDQMRIHDSRIHRGIGTYKTPCTPTMATPISTSSPTVVTASTSTITTTVATTITTTAAAAATTTTNAIIVETASDAPDLSCPHCPHTFTSHTGMVGRLRIHRTEAGEPMPGAPAYTPHQPQLRSLLPHVQPPHGPIRSYAYSRKPAADHCRLCHTITSPPISTCTTHQYHTPPHKASTQLASLLHL
ncbi:hypothetical protein SprV_0100163500 [Sparganum proliferum]